LAQVKARDAASLIVVRDEAFNGMLVVPGRKVESQDVLIFSSSGIHTDVKALHRMVGTEDRLMRVTQTEFPQFPAFMQEYALRVAFLALAEPAMRRFEQLAGDALTDRLGQEVNTYAYHQGWKIQFFGTRVVHKQYFLEAGEAAVVYRGLFRIVRQYAQRVVGAALAANVLTEGLKDLPPIYRNAFNQHDFLSV
jgi:hypothetical protein